ncbi:P-loop containing nucleoside triphosphate hydrolase protein [Xylariaceae sp. FL0255]|nr:P-loop containing nucleoside triphosphate hydrolase protein [Xylariaceae sp. FL0255]
MSLREPRRRSRALFEGDDDEDLTPSPPDSSKRRKRVTVDEDDSDVSPEPPRRRPNGTKAPTNGHTPNPSDFHPGAIVRVRVQNFVTYEQAEFLPGPNLNMVIGPNGTGKSSLVCAICLGLGYSPKHLGRASTYGEFVKHGKDQATIEVELQKRPEERANHIIRVTIYRDNSFRKWLINGKDANSKGVQDLVRSLRIQIDNLCQFLPQDKVAEFAGLTPTRLLEETLRAAAPEEILEQQTQLKSLHNDLKGVKKEVEKHADTLNNLENRQKGIEADVNRLREREAIIEQVKKLQDALIVAEYNHHRALARTAKENCKSAERELKQLQEDSGPALEAVNAKQEYQAQIEPVVDERRQALKDTEQAGMEMLRRIEIHDDKLKSVQDLITAEESSVHPKKIAISKIRTKITALEAEHKQKPPEFVAADWNAKIRQKEGIRREIEAELRELGDRFDTLKAQNVANTDAFKALNAEEQALDSQQGKKEAQMKRERPEVFQGWEWLKAHKDEFEKEVFGPPMLTCSITDQRYSNHVQSLLSLEDYFCFICQTVSDHKKLSNQFYAKLGLSVTIRTTTKDLSEFRPIIPRDQLPSLGLDAYAIDFMEGPKPVLANLCFEKKLHLAPVGLQEISNNQFEKLTAIEQIPRFASGKMMFHVARRREYGPKATSTTSLAIRPARFWTDQLPDESERQDIARRKEEIETNRRTLQNEGRDIKHKLASCKGRSKEAEEEIESLKEQKGELQRAATQYATITDRLAIAKEGLESALNDMQEMRNRLSQLSADEDDLCLDRARLVLDHQSRLTNICNAHQALLDAQIRLIEARSDVTGLEDRNKNLKDRLDKAKEKIQHLKEEHERTKKEAERFREELASMAPSAELIGEMSQLARGKTVEDLRNDISTEKARLEYVHAVDPAVLRQYESRVKEIQEKTKTKEELTKQFESLSEKIKDLRDSWEPHVDALITKINNAFAYNFEQINCAGQVDIHKDEDDFDAWAIEIKVKFRQNETLQQLNQHRQSGGERAVSTIFYLMALQSMAQAPFRVVDEINQGMDPRNERMVHERMVEIACNEHTSQYFLITPKLLTSLRYDERMRVLCIASGEHMPTEGRKLDFRKLVRLQKAIAAA